MPQFGLQTRENTFDSTLSSVSRVAIRGRGGETPPTTTRFSSFTRTNEMNGTSVQTSPRTALPVSLSVGGGHQVADLMPVATVGGMDDLFQRHERMIFSPNYTSAGYGTLSVEDAR